jgi:predicted  nucleic acid-binding Zn-ribbon protein
MCDKSAKLHTQRSETLAALYKSFEQKAFSKELDNIENTISQLQKQISDETNAIEKLEKDTAQAYEGKSRSIEEEVNYLVCSHHTLI